jgi:hypothetical protein
MELLAMQMVMEAEKQLGNEPRDVSGEKCGYDIESKVQADGKLRFIEVKGRVAGALTVTVTRNEILTALNKPDDFILAVGQVEDGQQKLVYIRQPFQQEPEFAVESINYNLADLAGGLERSRSQVRDSEAADATSCGMPGGPRNCSIASTTRCRSAPCSSGRWTGSRRT